MQAELEDMRISVYISIIVMLMLSACARIGRPGGGPRDQAPPVVVRAKPGFGTLNFNEKYITLYFNEYVQLKDLYKHLVISPPMDPMPEITPLGTASKFIRIKIKDTLRPNTTYIIQFGESISDFTEGNVLKDFSYVFSTGSYIDSLELKGKVLPSFFAEKPKDVYAMLYPAADSVAAPALQAKPAYITKAGSNGDFVFHFLPSGSYDLVLLKDQNADYIYNPVEEAVGFVREQINVPTDSVFSVPMFYENPPPGISGVKILSSQHILLGYTGPEKPVVERLEENGKKVEYKYYKEEHSDSLHIWLKSPVKDSVRVYCRWKDTLLSRKAVRLGNQAADSLMFRVKEPSVPETQDSIVLTANRVLTSAHADKIHLIDKDSVRYDIRCKITDGRLLSLHFDNKRIGEYRLLFQEGALETYTGDKCPERQLGFKSVKASHYGGLMVELPGDSLSYGLIQILDNNHKMIREQKTKPGEKEVEFELLPPGEYRIRYVYDDNRNGRWDTGNYKEKNYAEKVIYYDSPVKIKSNWKISVKKIHE